MKRCQQPVTRCLCWVSALAWCLFSWNQCFCWIRMPHLSRRVHWTESSIDTNQVSQPFIFQHYKACLHTGQDTMGHDGQEWCHAKGRLEPGLERWLRFVLVGQWEGPYFERRKVESTSDVDSVFAQEFPRSWLAAFSQLFFNVKCGWGTWGYGCWHE